MVQGKQSADKKKLIRQGNRIAELKKLLVYFKEITETVREPFIILNKDLYVVTANQSFYTKFKVHKKDTENKLIYELGNNQWDSPDLRELLEHILPKHRVLNNYEVTHDFPSLGHKTMLLNARQVDSKQLILLAIEDITTQRRLQTDADEMTSNLTKHRDKLQGLNNAKDEFISLASHQLRTPATVVKQYTGMLADGYAGDVSEAQARMLAIIYDSNQRQLAIIEDLLRVARVDAGKVYLEKSSCDVVQQVEAVIAEQAVLFERRHQRVTFSKPKAAVMAFMDPKLMAMVVANLLDNAGKYSPQDAQIVVAIVQDDIHTMVSITDKGIGIRKADQQKLFKKFSRIQNPISETVPGTGLGLYWAKKILDLHKGSIAVSSKLHAGSTFTIKMPIEPGDGKI